MKQYTIDDIRPDDYKKIKAGLGQKYGEPDLGGLYWVPLPLSILEPVQAAHEDCHPLCFAIELFEDKVSAELLVRTRKRMRCDCMAYANTEQRNWLVEQVDGLLEKLGVIA